MKDRSPISVVKRIWKERHRIVHITACFSVLKRDGVADIHTFTSDTDRRIEKGKEREAVNLTYWSTLAHIAKSSGRTIIVQSRDGETVFTVTPDMIDQWSSFTEGGGNEAAREF